MKQNITKTSDTKKMAALIKKALSGGDVIGLIGPLGAGKTTFTQCLAKQLGVTKPVNSPTFNIVKIYQTNHSQIKKLIHIDAYRLSSGQELEFLGVEEYFVDNSALTIIEWADKVMDILPSKTHLLKFSLIGRKRFLQLPKHYCK